MAIPDISLKIIGAGHFGTTSAQVKIGAEINEPTLLYSAFIKKKFVCEVNSFAFNGNLLHWEHDSIFALPLRLSVKHYYKQVIVFTLRRILN